MYSPVRQHNIIEKVPYRRWRDLHYTYKVPTQKDSSLDSIALTVKTLENINFYLPVTPVLPSRDTIILKNY